METADKTSAPFNTYATQSGIPTNILPRPSNPQLGHRRSLLTARIAPRHDQQQQHGRNQSQERRRPNHLSPIRHSTSPIPSIYSVLHCRRPKSASVHTFPGGGISEVPRISRSSAKSHNPNGMLPVRSGLSLTNKWRPLPILPNANGILPARPLLERSRSRRLDRSPNSGGMPPVRR